MMGSRPRLTRKELVHAVATYARVFPEWEHERGSRIMRSQGPVTQQIGFQILRAGPYRVTMAVWAMTEPKFQMLPQILWLESHQDTMRDCESKWEGVVAAMEQQFRPSVPAPLDLHELRSLCEQEALERVNDLCFLAIFNAHLGDRERAIHFSERAEAVPPRSPEPRPDRELRKVEFGRRLRAAVEAGEERRFLDAAAEAAPKPGSRRRKPAVQ